MLQRCLTGWHLLLRMQREQGAILAQRQETRNKMDAFITAVSTSKPAARDTANSKSVKDQIEAANHQENKDEVRFTLSNSHAHILCGSPQKWKKKIEIGPCRKYRHHRWQLKSSRSSSLNYT